MEMENSTVYKNEKIYIFSGKTKANINEQHLPRPRARYTLTYVNKEEVRNLALVLQNHRVLMNWIQTGIDEHEKVKLMREKGEFLHTG